MKPLLLLLCLAFASVLSAADDTVKISGPENLRQHVEPAKEVADRFIKFFDQSNLRGAQSLSKNRLDLKGREEQLAAFGKMETRTLTRIRVSDSFPPMPDGVYVIFFYETSFAKKKSLPQTVTLRLSDSGKPEVVKFDVNSAN